MITDTQTDFLYLADYLPEFYADFFVPFADILEKHKIEWDLLPHTKDIWAVDYMPIQVTENDFVQFVYDPIYLNTPELKATISDVVSICQAINIRPRKPKFKIKLDGGNVIKSADKIIMTERIFKDNARISKDRLIGELKDCFRTDRLYFIPEQPYDFTGHADGMVRFLDENTLVINDYSKESQTFQTKFKKAIDKMGLTCHEIPYYPSEDTESAFGCYINYLQMKDFVVMPTFGNKRQDAEALKLFKDLFKGQIIETVDCTIIAKEGGVLNCISWNINNGLARMRRAEENNSWREMWRLSDEYMKHNPGSTSPSSVYFSLGPEGMVELLKKANNRRIKFWYEKGIMDGLEWEIEEK